MELLEWSTVEYLWESMRDGRLMGRGRAGAGKFFFNHFAFSTLVPFMFW